MSQTKGNTDQISKGKLYQTKTYSDKSIPTGNKDLTNILHLTDFIKQSKIEELKNYINTEKPSQFELKIAITELLKNYEQKKENFYIMLDIFLESGFPINSGINITQLEDLKYFNFKELGLEETTLLIIAILLDDIEFVKIVLKYHNTKTINQIDNKGRSAIVYSILYNKNDNADILNLLIENGSEVNQTFKLETTPNKFEDHSIFTLACKKNLPKIIKVLVDNPKVYVNYSVFPSGDTGLHICARNGLENVLKIILSCDRINTEILNSEGKKAPELISENEDKNYIMKLFVNYYIKTNTKNKMNMKMGGNLSLMKKDNEPGNMNNMNKAIINNEQININIINQENINNINNKNKEYKNYLNNNIYIKNKMANVNNNLEQNQLRQNLNKESITSNESSDFSEEQESKENINNNINNKNIKSQNNNMVNNNLSQVLPQNNTIKLLNQNIYNNLITNNNNLNFNVEIPIKIIDRKKDQFKSEKFRALNNFFCTKANSIPLLNLDINDKTFQLELEINELNSQISEMDKESKKIKEEIKENEQDIIKKREELLKKEELLNKYNIELNDCNEKEKKLKEEQDNILSQLPNDKVYKKTNKDSNKKELKFSLNEMDELEMYKILNKDLLDYELYITEILRRQNNILQIDNRINEIRNILRGITNEYEIKIYGSYALGLNMEWSDVDLVLVKVENPENENNDENILLMQQNNNDIQNDNVSVANTDSTRESVNLALLNQNNNYPNQINNSNSNILENLAQRLSQLDWVKTIKSRENLEIRILRIECGVNVHNELKRFDIDISLESEKHYGLKCVDLIKSYLKEYTVLKPLTIALRAILHSANLHLPDKGGLSAYGLILMVVSYIQSQKDFFTKEELNLCGKMFYGFLKHYGIMFDFNKYLILTYPANELNSANTDKESYINMNQYGQEFIILDPLNNTNNVAGKSYQFMNLKMAFMIAYMVTKEDCDCGCHFGEAEFENSFQSTDHCYLKRMLNSVRRFQG